MINRWYVLCLAIIMVVALIANYYFAFDQQGWLLIFGLGVLIAMMINQLFFSIRRTHDFFAGILPLLRALKMYSSILTSHMINAQHRDSLIIQRLDVEKALLSRYSSYPNWVYEPGFNPGLRASWRYFLINIERAVEIYFALTLIVERHIDLALLSDQMKVTMQKNEELLDILCHYVEHQQNKKIESDFSTDMTMLEEALQRIVPNQLELLDISPDYVSLVSVVRYVRDLRKLLLQLVMALPA